MRGIDAVRADGDRGRGGAASAAVLELRGYGVAFGKRVILGAVDLAVPDRSVTVLMGPAGTGKSTLLRTLAGFNAGNPSMRVWGMARYAGARLDESDAPALVAQSARLMTASVLENVVHDLPERGQLTPLQQRDLTVRLLQRAGLGALRDRIDEPVVRLPLAIQRRLAILRLAASAPRLLCVDEPTTGLDERDSHALLEFISAESAHRAVLVVLHNQAHARRLGGRIALLAGGAIQECAPAGQFLAAPQSAAARDFVRNGNCCVPSPDADPELLDDAYGAPPPLPDQARHHVSDSFGPRGFLWLKNGVLAGTPRPGVVHDIDYDLKALQRVGVTVLVSLTRKPIDPQALRPYGIRAVRSPIPDMAAPGIAQARNLCRRMSELIRDGQRLAVHCRAGLGRTGTVLAAYLVWEGATALDALESVRRIEPRWVQSDEQVAFLEKFAAALGRADATPHAGAAG